MKALSTCRAAIAGIVALLLCAGLAHGQSTIDPTQPAANSMLSSSVIRALAAAAAGDINGLVEMHAGATAPSPAYNGEDWLNTTATPAVWNKYAVPCDCWTKIATINLSTGVVLFSGTPIGVPNNAALEALSTASVPIGIVTRLGFAAVGDSPAVQYTPSNSTCPLNLGAGDGGSQVPSSNGGCWLLVPPWSINVAIWGAQFNWTSAGGTDNSPYWQAAIAYACSLPGSANFVPYTSSSNGVTLTDGGLPDGIGSSGIYIPSGCALQIFRNFHALAGTWNDGRVFGGTTWPQGGAPEHSVPVNVASLTPPTGYVLPNVWNPINVFNQVTGAGSILYSEWPSITITGITNLGGLIEVTIPGHGLATGNQVNILGVTGNNANGTWKITKVDANNVTLNGSVYSGAWTGGGLVNDGVPIAMTNVLQGASLFVLPGSSSDCTSQDACVANANYGVLVQDHETILNYTAAGTFTCGNGSHTQIMGGHYIEDTVGRGYARYWTCLVSDSFAVGVDFAASDYQSFFVDYGSANIHESSSHDYNADLWQLFTSSVSSYYPDYTGTFVGSGLYSVNTQDAGAILIIARDVGNHSCSAPYVQITGNWGYGGAYLRAPLSDAPVVYRPDPAGTCTSAHLSSYVSPNNNAIGLDPNQFGWIGNTVTPGMVFGNIVALEDINGNGPGSQIWDTTALRQAGFLNNYEEMFSGPAFSLGPSSATTFTANLVSGSQQMAAVQVLPAVGTAISDSGGCIAASTVVGGLSLNPAPGWVWLTKPTVGTGNCTSDTLTIGGKTFAGVTVAAPGAIYVGGVPFPTLRKGMSISSTHIPANSYVDSWDPTTGTLVWHNAAGTGATATETAETITLTPFTYEFQPDDDGVFLLLNGNNNRSAFLPQFLPSGWTVDVALGTATETVTPEGSATINGLTGTQTFNDSAPYTQTRIKAAGSNSGASTYLTTNNLGVGGPGNVTGPASSTNNDLAAFSGTSGEVIIDTGILYTNVAQINASNVFIAAQSIASASASALAVGLNGATNPAFVVNDSTASQVAGLRVTGAASGGTVAVATIGPSGTNNLTIDALGTGTIGIGTISTGAVTIGTGVVVNPSAGSTGILSVTNTNTATSGLQFLENKTFTINPASGTITSTIRGESRLTNYEANLTYTGTMSGQVSTSENTGTGTMATVYGTFEACLNGSTGSITSCYGISGNAHNTGASGTGIGTGVGVDGEALNTGAGNFGTAGYALDAILQNSGGGTMPAGEGLHIWQPTGGSSSIWTNISGIHISDMNPSGTNSLTNPPAALLIDSQSASGAFAIEQVGSGLNSFAGVSTFSAGLTAKSNIIAAGGNPVGTTGSCVASSFSGGLLAGKFSAAVCAASTIILSSLPAAPTGYACSAWDETTPADTLKETAFTTTSVTFTATTVSADAVVFHCLAF